MGLVAAVARRYRDLGLPDEDLRQEGAIGLLEAIDRFDPTIGATFATYARWRVRQSISHALSSRGRLLRLPKEITERRRLIARSTPALVGGGATPTAGEIAECTGLSKAQVVEALEAPAFVASLDTAADGEAPLEATLADPARPDPATDAIDARVERAVDEAVSRLPARERAVIEAHYGLGRDEVTLAEIGAQLGLSETRVRALERRALEDLAMQLESELTQS
jgi:RNA polymerase primary sigma factor